MNGVTVFRPLKKRRKVNVDLLGKVVAQMQGLMDTDPEPDNVDQVAFHGLVETWHGMLQTALIEEAKRN